MFLFCSRGCAHGVRLTPGYSLPPFQGCNERDLKTFLLRSALPPSHGYGGTSRRKSRHVNGPRHMKISPNGATDFSQGIHPLETRIKKTPSPNGAAEKPVSRKSILSQDGLWYVIRRRGRCSTRRPRTRSNATPDYLLRGPAASPDRPRRYVSADRLCRLRRSPKSAPP